MAAVPAPAPAEIPAAYAAFRLPIPAPVDLTDEHKLFHVNYIAGEETLAQYCRYVQDLCVAWSRKSPEFATCGHPLGICYIIMDGLPDEDPWRDVKADLDDLVVENFWGRMVPNNSKYKDRDSDDYWVDPHSLQGLLESMEANHKEMVQQQAEDEEMDDIAEEEDKDPPVS